MCFLNMCDNWKSLQKKTNIFRNKSVFKRMIENVYIFRSKYHSFMFTNNLKTEKREKYKFLF